MTENMKLDEIFDELMDLAKRTGITVRKDNGKFRSAYCVLNEKKVIVFNRTTPIETKSAVLAKCLLDQPIDNMYIKPAVRDFIEKENLMIPESNEFSLEIEY